MLAFIDLGPQAVSEASSLMAEAKGLYPVGVATPLSNAKLLAPFRARARTSSASA